MSANLTAFQAKPKGPRGPKGFTGPRGSNGPPGLKGSTGVSGPTGVIGPTGVAGQGVIGPSGIQGPQGVSQEGSKGPTGVQGDSGVIGDTGVIGITGARGPTGVIGQAGGGPTGVEGITGSVGPTGVIGPIGEIGPTGVVSTGLQGQTGLKGPTGIQGDTGVATVLEDQVITSGSGRSYIFNQKVISFFSSISAFSPFSTIVTSGQGSVTNFTNFPLLVNLRITNTGSGGNDVIFTTLANNYNVAYNTLSNLNGTNASVVILSNIYNTSNVSSVSLYGGGGSSLKIRFEWLYYTPPEAPSGPPNAPENLQITDYSFSSISVAWEAPFGRAKVDGYIIYLGDGANPDFQTAASQSIGKVLTYTYNTPPIYPDSTYHIWVAASNTTDTGPTAGPASQTTPPAPPETPTNFMVASSKSWQLVKSTSIGLTWFAGAGGETLGYYVYKNTTDDFNTADGPESASEVPYTSYSLTPNTNYYFWVLATGLGGTISPPTDSLSVKTQPGVPRDFAVTSFGSTSVTFSWQGPELGTPTTYYIYTSETDNVEEVIAPLNVGNVLTAEIVDLIPNTTYYFWIAASDDELYIGDTTTLSLSQTTAEELPGIVDNFVVDSFTSTEVALIWDIPISGGQVNSYYVYINTTNDIITASQYNTVDEYYTFQDLTPNTDYYFWVTAYGPGGEGEPNVNVQKTSSGGEPPGLPIIDTITPSQTSIQVSWIAPAEVTVNGYKGYISLDTFQNAYEAFNGTFESNLLYTFDAVYDGNLETTIDLTANTPYYMWIIAYNDDGDSDPLEIGPIQTLAHEPVGLAITNLGRSANSIEVEWAEKTDNGDPPQTLLNIPTRYRPYISLSDDFAIALEQGQGNSPILNTQFSHQFSNLTDNTFYYIWIVSENIDDIQSPSAPFAASTSPSTPGEPETVGNTFASSSQTETSISLSWTLPESGGSIKHLILKVNNTNDRDSELTEEYILPLSPSYTTIENFNAAPLVTGDTYYFWLATFNTDGTSAYEQVIQATTVPAPGAVTVFSVESWTSTSIRLTWDPPEDGGAPTSYYVYKSLTTTIDTNDYEEVPAEFNHKDITELDYNTTYYFWIAAHNATATSETAQQPISQITNKQVPAIIEFVVQGNTTSTSITITWSNGFDGGDPDGYYIYFGTTDVFVNATKSGEITDTFTTYNSLEPDTDYYVWATAYNNGGESQPSSQYTTVTTTM
jgi:hypothetical protein